MFLSQRTSLSVLFIPRKYRTELATHVLPLADSPLSRPSVFGAGASLPGLVSVTEVDILADEDHSPIPLSTLNALGPPDDVPISV